MKTNQLVKLFDLLKKSNKCIRFGDLMRKGFSSPLIFNAIKIVGGIIEVVNGYSVIKFV